MKCISDIAGSYRVHDVAGTWAAMPSSLTASPANCSTSSPTRPTRPPTNLSVESANRGSFCSQPCSLLGLGRHLLLRRRLVRSSFASFRFPLVLQSPLDSQDGKLTVSFALAAIGFPVIILLLIPLRTLVVPRLPFTAEELAILDGPTASPFVRPSLCDYLLFIPHYLVEINCILWA